MPLFNSKKFLILPNRNASTLQFISQLIAKEGGILVNKEEEIDKNTLVLINDSFVGNGNNLTKVDLFFKEFDLDPEVVWNIVQANELRCIKAASVSRWLRAKSLDINARSIINVQNCNRMPHVTTSAVDAQNVTTTTDKLFESTSQVEKGSSFAESSQGLSEHSQEATRALESHEINSDMSQQNIVTVSQVATVPKGNEKIIQALGKLSKRYEMKGDRFRARSYNLAKLGIERYPSPIQSGEYARKYIDNVGPSIAKKIQTILDSGTLPGLQEQSEAEKRLDYFSRCHNVGIYTAKRWEMMGLKSFSQACIKFPADFTKEWSILFGWSYYEDWLKPMSRDECERNASIVVEELSLIDPRMKIEILGSYHRGADKCGDIDLFFYKPGCDDISEIAATMEKLAISLYEKGYVQCFLQLTRNISGLFHEKIAERMRNCGLKMPSTLRNPSSYNDHLKKFMLGVKLIDKKRPTFSFEIPKLASDDKFMSLGSDENPCRRMDFFCCKYSELGAARIQWIGPKEFNRWIRLKAISNGLKLTQHGLYDNDNVLLESFNERRIFELLNEEYVSPAERNYIVKKRMKL